MATLVDHPLDLFWPFQHILYFKNSFILYKIFITRSGSGWTNRVKLLIYGVSINKVLQGCTHFKAIGK